MFRQKVFVVTFLVLMLINPSSLTPIVATSAPNTDNGVFVPAGFCLLPPELGNNGSIKFLEDCQSLDRFEILPLPGNSFYKYGTHPVVCCPKVLLKSSICFESDPWCPSYKPPQLVSEEFNVTTVENGDEIPILSKPDIFVQQQPKMSDKQCATNGQFANLPGVGDLNQCVTINRCGKILDDSDAPAPASDMWVRQGISPSNDLLS